MRLITCPECRTKLRLKAELAPGKRVRCSKCSAAFAPNGEDDAPLVLQAEKRKAAAAPPQEDDVWVEEDFEVVEEKQPTRRPRRAEQDFEVVEDEQPARPRKRAEQDFEVVDDERPVRGRRQQQPVEEAEDKPPVRRSRRQRVVRERSNLVLILGMAIGGGVLIVAAVVGLILFIVLSPSKTYREHEAILKDEVKLIVELTETLEGIQDPNSAKAAAPKLEQICDRLEDLERRQRALPEPSEKEKKQLQEKAMAELGKLTGRLGSAGLQATQKAQNEPTFLAALKKYARLGGGRSRSFP